MHTSTSCRLHHLAFLWKTRWVALQTPQVMRVKSYQMTLGLLRAPFRRQSLCFGPWSLPSSELFQSQSHRGGPLDRPRQRVGLPLARHLLLVVVVEVEPVVAGLS